MLNSLCRSSNARSLSQITINGQNILGNVGSLVNSITGGSSSSSSSSGDCSSWNVSSTYYSGGGSYNCVSPAPSCSSVLHRTLLGEVPQLEICPKGLLRRWERGGHNIRRLEKEDDSAWRLVYISMQGVSSSRWKDAVPMSAHDLTGAYT